MKKTIRKIVSKSLAIVTAIATVVSPIMPSITAHAAALGDTPSVTSVELTADMVDYEEQSDIIKVNGIKVASPTNEYVINAEPFKSAVGSNKSVVLANSFFGDTGAGIVLGEGVGLEHTNMNGTKKVTFLGNNKMTDADFNGLFANNTTLTNVNGFGKFIKANGSGEVNLTETFRGCTALKEVDIDLTSSSTPIRLNGTFDGCNNLEAVVITSANISKLLHVTGSDGEGANNTTFDFRSCLLSTDPGAMEYAFDNFTGTIKLENCSCAENGKFTLKNFVSGPDTAKGNLNLEFSNSKVGTIDGLICGGKYNSVILNGVISADTETVNTIFGHITNTTVNDNVELANLNTTGLNKLVAPYICLDMGSADKEEAEIRSFLTTTDLTNVTEYNTIGHTANNNYSDLTNVNLNQAQDAVYYETSSDVSGDAFMVPEKFITAKNFGGSYFLSFEAWEKLSETEFKKVDKDASQDIPLANKESSTLEGYKYNFGKLTPETEYTHSKAKVTFTDVYKNETETTTCAGGTKIQDVLGFKDDVEYFTDETLKTAFDSTDYVVEANAELNLYYTTAPSTEQPTPTPGTSPTPTPSVEPDYSVIYNMPTGCAFDLPSDLTKVNATFDDGTIGPLAQDGSVVKFTIDSFGKPEAYGQTSEFANFPYKSFFTVDIEVTNGETTKAVKSLNTELTCIYYQSVSDIDSRLSAVFYYGESTNKTPTRLVSSWYDLGDKDTVQFQFNKTGKFVLLTGGASYNNTEKTAKYTINWNDTGHEDKRPTSVILEWEAHIPEHIYDEDDENDKVTGTHTVNVDKSLAVQSGTYKYPKSNKNFDLHIARVEVADIPNYVAEVIQGTTACTINLTYSPTALEQIVENIPEGSSVNFGKDAKQITATLEDGTTKPLVSDDTSLIINVEPKVLTVYQNPRGQAFDKISFYDVELLITDGTTQWEVKSIDSPMGIAIPIPADCGKASDIKVWHYDEGIMTAPKEVTEKSITSSHVVIPTTSYSYYAITYNVGDTEQKTITIDWDDTNHESERPTSVVADWTATYADDSTETGTTVFNRDVAVKTQSNTINVPKDKDGNALVSTVANIRAVTGYEVVTNPTDPLKFTLKYVGNTASVVTVRFDVELIGKPEGVAYPASVPLTVYTWYTDGTKDTYETTLAIGSDGTGSQAVERPIKNEEGSTYRRTTWEWGTVDGYSLTNKTSYAVYEYGGSGSTVQTVYPVTIKFTGDTADKTKRPTSLSVTWTATTASGSSTTGTVAVTVTNTTDSFSQNVTIPNPTGEKRTVIFAGPVLQGYNMTVSGSTITYNYATTSTTNNSSYEIIFDDEDNKCGRRPSELNITFTDTTNKSNTITSKLTIAENTTTKIKSYKGNIAIPVGTTYAITKVETLPDGYEASYSGLSATLKYKPEMTNKTFKIEWKDDVEDVRPSSVKVTVKSGDTEGATLTLKKDTNWAASADLLKYIKGVEASWKPEVENVTNYSASVDGETITMKYTGTLTEEQKNAIKATDKDAIAAEKEAAEKEKEAIYDFEKFDWIDYANRYPDVKKAFGYNKEALYAHYIHYGIAEGRIATWTGKYDNVNEDILAAYFPNDYKYKAEHTSSVDEMLDEMNGGSTVSGNSVDSSNVTVDKDGNTVIKKDNGDGTTTETVIDKDGNVVQTKTYATGDNRMNSMLWVYFAIIAVALCLGVICFRDFRESDKNRKFLDSHIKS